MNNGYFCGNIGNGMECTYTDDSRAPFDSLDSCKSVCGYSCMDNGISKDCVFDSVNPEFATKSDCKNLCHDPIDHNNKYRGKWYYPKANLEDELCHCAEIEEDQVDDWFGPKFKGLQACSLASGCSQNPEPVFDGPWFVKSTLPNGRCSCKGTGERPPRDVVKYQSLSDCIYSVGGPCVLDKEQNKNCGLCMAEDCKALNDLGVSPRKVYGGDVNALFSCKNARHAAFWVDPNAAAESCKPKKCCNSLTCNY